jgi:peptidoglycan L-alanyl-D-glutamate endopeptidase CwlK
MKSGQLRLIHKSTQQQYNHCLHQKNLANDTPDSWIRHVLHFSTTHKWLITFAILSVFAPSALIWLINSNNMLDGFDDTHLRTSNYQVTALLQGEQLVPPPALPPEMFTTQEVTLIRPTLIDASRNWQLLDNDFSQRLLLTFKIMKERYGYDMTILEGYRSPERQNKLASMGSSVTNAAAYQSYHQFGLAADCAFQRDGKLIISEKDPWAMRGYQLYGEVAESLGMRWGGRWKMMDFGHIELRKPNTISHP